MVVNKAVQDFEEELFEVLGYPLDCADIVAEFVRRGDGADIEIVGYRVSVSDLWMRRFFKFPKQVPTLENAADPVTGLVRYTNAEWREIHRCIDKRGPGKGWGGGIYVFTDSAGKKTWMIGDLTMRSILGIRKKQK